MEEFSKIYREMVFNDCKVQKMVSFLLRFQVGCEIQVFESCRLAIARGQQRSKN